MGILDIIGSVILLAILIGLCLCCTRTCRRKKQPENRRKRRRQQKNARRKRRRHQRNCPAPHPTNAQTRIQIQNPPPQQQQINISNSSMPPPGFQAAVPHQQYPNSSSQSYLQFHNQQYLNLCQSPQNQQFMFANQQIPQTIAQQGDLYPFPPPPYEPPEQLPTERQLETRITMPGLDINQFARPPPPPYDEELQCSEPFKLN